VGTAQRRLLYIKSGLFSHTNTLVREQLEAHFPELQVEVLDLWTDLLRGRRADLLLGIAQAALIYRGRAWEQRNALRSLALRTPYLFRKVRRLVAEHVKGREGEYRFAFQTQSLFDASVPGLPHFVFTDHTHLANLRYPGFRKETLFPPSWIALEREIYEHARQIFVMADHVRASAIEDYGIDPARVTTVYGGSNIDPTPSPLANENYGNRTVVFIGIDWARKGGPVLVEAFRRLRTQMPDARLIVIGCQPGIGEPWCEEIGKVPRETVKQHLLRGSVLCLPTRIEPLGIAVIEAFHQRIPAVVSDVGAMPSIVRNGETGRVVPVDDPAALAEALGEMLRDPERCRAYGEAAYADVRARYSWPAVGARLRAEIDRALAAAGSSVRSMSAGKGGFPLGS